MYFIIIYFIEIVNIFCFVFIYFTQKVSKQETLHFCIK